MDMMLKEQFIDSWNKYFTGADLPITFFFAAGSAGIDMTPPAKGWRCLIADLARVRNGQSLCLSVDSIGCAGGKRYLGLGDSIRPNFEYFLSCGIPGEMEGERYIKTPEMVREIMKHQVTIGMSGKNIIFKRWDALTKEDDPAVVVFFAKPDVLSGLFTLANFDETEPNVTYTPFGAGCASIVHYPFHEIDSPRPRAVIGMFDVSARPFVPSDRLTFAVPMTKFMKMAANMDESFLITPSWEAVRKRIASRK